MKFLLVPSALLLFANKAGAEIPGMRVKLQAILTDCSAELDRRFETRLNQVIESREMDSALGRDLLASQSNSESSKPGLQPAYLACQPGF